METFAMDINTSQYQDGSVQVCLNFADAASYIEASKLFPMIVEKKFIEELQFEQLPDSNGDWDMTAEDKEAVKWCQILSDALDKLDTIYGNDTHDETACHIQAIIETIDPVVSSMKKYTSEHPEKAEIIGSYFANEIGETGDIISAMRKLTKFANCMGVYHDIISCDCGARHLTAIANIHAVYLESCTEDGYTPNQFDYLASILSIVLHAVIWNHSEFMDAWHSMEPLEHGHSISSIVADLLIDGFANNVLESMCEDLIDMRSRYDLHSILTYDVMHYIDSVNYLNGPNSKAQFPDVKKRFVSILDMINVIEANLP